MSATLRSVLLATATLLVLAAPASAKRYDVPAVMGDKLIALNEESPLAVFLPQSLVLGYDGDLFAIVDATSSKAWTIDLAGDPECNGANACTLAWLSAQKGAKRSNPTKVTLTKNVNGWFRKTSCGGSCSPGSIEFTRNKVLYEIQAKVAQKGKSEKQLLIAAANSAISAGPR
ncbi:MAG: hypothetical protein JHC95_23100 [Solirubrobacteraceae bacterium]|nr:hypothetical protein [Solirubrobacteraceae bacterium]